MHNQSLLISCVQAVQTARFSLCLNPASIHSLAKLQANTVHKHDSYTPPSTELSTFLYATYAPVFSLVRSVMNTFMHIIHRPYIYQNKMNKGEI
jgi:hypothetical protein